MFQMLLNVVQDVALRLYLGSHLLVKALLVLKARDDDGITDEKRYEETRRQKHDDAYGYGYRSGHDGEGIGDHPDPSPKKNNGRAADESIDYRMSAQARTDGVLNLVEKSE